MKVINVQEFIDDQSRLRMDRRFSQHMRFLDRTPSFVTYYPINKIESTTEFMTDTIDTYIGEDSPIKYNKIKNLPLYGFPTITTETEYDELIGASNDSYSAEAIIVPGVIVPCEGDCFVHNVIGKTHLFMVNEVREVTLKSKSHFYISFHIEITSKLDLLEKQVIDEYISTFDNIGTQDKVVVKKSDFIKMNEFKKVYTNMHDYYIDKYFQHRTTTFETLVKYRTNCERDVNFCDRFLLNFLEKNRIMVFDDVLKTSLTLDFNGIIEENIKLKYVNTFYHFIESGSFDRFKKANKIFMKKLLTPFSLYRGQKNDTLFITDKYVSNEEDDGLYSFVIDFDFEDIIKRCKNNSIFIKNPNDNIISLIVKYFNDSVLEPSNFDGLYGKDIDNLTEYMLLPAIMFIIRNKIYEISRNL